MAVTRSPRPVQGCLSFASAPLREPSLERGELRRETLVLDTRAASPLRQEPLASERRPAPRQQEPRAARGRKPATPAVSAAQAAPTLVVLGRWDETPKPAAAGTRSGGRRAAVGPLVFEALGTVLAVGSMLLAAAYL
jgi:hypothetical protein